MQLLNRGYNFSVAVGRWLEPRLCFSSAPKASMDGTHWQGKANQKGVVSAITHSVNPNQPITTSPVSSSLDIGTTRLSRHSFLISSSDPSGFSVLVATAFLMRRQRGADQRRHPQRRSRTKDFCLLRESVPGNTCLNAGRLQ